MFKGMSDLKSAMKEGENRGTDDPKNLTSIISVFQRPLNSQNDFNFVSVEYGIFLKPHRYAYSAIMLPLYGG